MPKAAFLACLGILVAGLDSGAPAQEQDRKIDLAVLYAGDPGAPRTKDWTEFLGGTFRRVDSVDLSRLSEETARGHDVVIVDWPTPYSAEGTFDMPETPRLTTGFTRPVILMGVAGGSLLRTLDIKLRWL